MNSNMTLDFYNENAQNFVDGTLNVQFTHIQDKFLAKLKEGAYILDFGCGSGRDTKYFLDKGYEVEAVDGSEALCEIAAALTGTTVKQMLFQELNETEKYDAIWACSSILHLSYAELEDVLKKMVQALKADGVIYTSFKYGTFEGTRNGRYFTDMTEERFENLINSVDNVETEELWITADARPGREDEKWLNLFLRKK